MNTDVASRILDIVARQSGKDRAVVTTGMTLKELEVDSLEAIETVFEIEEAFGIQLADDQNRTGTDTLQDLIAAVEAALAHRDGPANSAHAA
ncbi:MAG TPA: acyl carrier protein [Luteibacter sp.]|jgi:acyl carrier protein|uniref:acyl carrier protein n=1 Tax=Luteibacter sp. TaxID=1886636 RepID=UPI002F4254F1